MGLNYSHLNYLYILDILDLLVGKSDNMRRVQWHAKSDQRGGLLKHMAAPLQEAAHQFSSTESLFVCLGFFRGEWLHLFIPATPPSASIYNLACLCSERLAWGKQRSAPRVLEDHCVNDPRAAHSRVALFKYRHQLLNASTWATPQTEPRDWIHSWYFIVFDYMVSRMVRVLLLWLAV